MLLLGSLPQLVLVTVHISTWPIAALGGPSLGIALLLVDGIEAHYVLRVHHIRIIIQITCSLVLNHYLGGQEVLFRVANCGVVALVCLHTLSVHIHRDIIGAIALVTVDSF